MRRLLSLIMLLLLLLTGCQAAPRPQPVTTIKVGVLPDSLSDHMIDLLIPPFQDAHPAIRVEKVTFAWGDLNPFAHAADKGQLDVVSCEQTNRFERRALDPFIAKSRFDTAPLGGVLEQLRTNGSVSEMPYAFWPAVLVYNKALLEAAHVPAPTPGWTWETFRDALRQLTHGQDEAKVWGLQSPWPADLVRAWMAGKTGRFSPVMEPAPFTEGLAFFKGLIKDDQSLPPDKLQGWGQVTHTSINFWDGLRAMNEGKAAFATAGLSSMGDLPDRITVPWDMAPMPAFPGRRPVSVASPLTLAIPEAAPAPDAAWEFIRFAAGAEGAKVLTQAGYQVFYNTDDVRETWEAAQKRLPPGAAAVWQTDWVLDRWVIQHSSNEEKAFARAVNEVLSGDQEIEAALNGYRLDLAGKR